MVYFGIVTINDDSRNEYIASRDRASAITVDTTTGGGGGTDTTAPKPTIISLSSNGKNPRYAKVGDTVTLTVTYDEDVVGAGTVTATVGGTDVTLTPFSSERIKIPSPSTPTSKAIYAFVVDAGTPEGEILVSVNGAEDTARNTQTEEFSYISPFTKVTIDKTLPVLSNPQVSTSNADNTKAESGDTITFSIDSTEEIVFPDAVLAGRKANFARGISAVGNIENNNTNILLALPRGVFVQGNYAYVVSYNSNALQIIDISTPSAPTAAATGNIDIGNPTGLFVQGNYAYVASHFSDALQIIDISDPSAPTAAGNIDNSAANTLLDEPQDVFVQGNYAYVVSSTSNALQIINISNPTTPTAAGNIDNSAANTLLDGPRDVFVQGDYAYVASQGSDALQIIDISNPSTPTAAGKISHNGSGTLLDGAIGVFVQGNYAYVISQNSDALQIINITDKDNPTAAGNIDNTASGTLLDRPERVFVQGSYAYVALAGSHPDYNAGLQIIDISNPTTPTAAGNIDNSVANTLLDVPRDVFVQGNYAYVASSDSGALQILGLENTYTAKSEVGPLNQEGPVSYDTGLSKDNAGNTPTTASTGTYPNLVIPAIPPVITGIIIENDGTRNPTLSFTASEPVVLTFGSNCPTPATVTASAGLNLISLQSRGSYDNCVITFTDRNGNTITHTLPAFRIRGGSSGGSGFVDKRAVYSAPSVFQNDLEVGSIGSDVTLLGEFLTSQGYNTNLLIEDDSNKFSEELRRLLIEYQRDNDLEPTGVFDLETRSKINEYKVTQEFLDSRIFADSESDIFAVPDKSKYETEAEYLAFLKELLEELQKILIALIQHLEDIRDQVLAADVEQEVRGQEVITIEYEQPDPNFNYVGAPTVPKEIRLVQSPISQTQPEQEVVTTPEEANEVIVTDTVFPTEQETDAITNELVEEEIAQLEEEASETPEEIPVEVIEEI